MLTHFIRRPSPLLPFFLLLLLASAALAQPAPAPTIDLWAVQVGGGMAVLVAVLLLVATWFWKDLAAAREKTILGGIRVVLQLGQAIAPLTHTTIDDDLVYLLGEFRKQLEAHGIDPTEKELAQARTAATAALADKVVATKFPAPSSPS